MCGIAAIIDFNHQIIDAEQVLNKMLSSIHHRGPDDYSSATFKEGVYLGHKRLSILDLDKRSSQPFVFEQFTLIYNGEIYNYQEIRATLINEGYEFQTTGDTEVLIKALHFWGASAVNRFIGMWAFVLYNAEKKEIFCSRDRFGIKPFYYIFKNGVLGIASEVKALKALPIFSNELNLKQVQKFLNLGWIHFKDNTLYEDVKCLEAANNLLFDGKKISKELYYLPTASKKTNEDPTKEFKNLFFESVALHMRSDVEVGACLSGGIDSSSLVCAINELYPKSKLKTFNIFYDKKGFNEKHFAEKVNNKYSNIEAYYHSPSENEVKASFDKFLWHQDFPPGGSSPMSQYFVMQLASSKGVKVVLDGQGADEYLIGYPHSFYRLYADQIRNFRLIIFLKSLNRQRKNQRLNWQNVLKIIGLSLVSVFKSEKEMLDLEYKKKWPKVLEKALEDDDLNRLKTFGKNRTDDFLFHLQYTSILPSLLHYEDRNSMAFSIESRVPFLNHHLIDFMLGVSNDWKTNNGITKFTLRNAMKDFLPKEIYERYDKMGFVTPGEVNWLKGPLQFLLQNLKDNHSQLFNKEAIEKIILDYENGDLSKAKFLWRCCVLNYWISNQK